MMVEQIDSFIDALIELTKAEKIVWTRFSIIDECQKLKNDIESSAQWNGDYVIEPSESYILRKNEGYVLLAVAKYGNAKVFSPVMNKVLLLTCVQKGTQIEILTDYGDFTERICELEESVVDKDKLLFPDALYEFFGKVTGV